VTPSIRLLKVASASGRDWHHYPKVASKQVLLKPGRRRRTHSVIDLMVPTRDTMQSIVLSRAQRKRTIQNRILRLRSKCNTPAQLVLIDD